MPIVVTLFYGHKGRIFKPDLFLIKGMCSSTFPSLDTKLQLKSGVKLEIDIPYIAA